MFFPATSGTITCGSRTPRISISFVCRPLNASVPGNVFVFLSGTFDRFTDADLLARYPTRHGYVKRVKRAAEELDDKGYITRKDRKALIEAAQDEPLYVSDFVK